MLVFVALLLVLVLLLALVLVLVLAVVAVEVWRRSLALALSSLLSLHCRLARQSTRWCGSNQIATPGRHALCR